LPSKVEERRNPSISPSYFAFFSRKQEAPPIGEEEKSKIGRIRWRSKRKKNKYLTIGRGA